MSTINHAIGRSTYEKLKLLAEQIRPGMYRYQVERLLPRSNGGIQGPIITLYNEFPGGKIEVPFDRNGGESGHMENKVNGPARIFVAVP